MDLMTVDMVCKAIEKHLHDEADNPSDMPELVLCGPPDGQMTRILEEKGNCIRIRIVGMVEAPVA